MGENEPSLLDRAVDAWRGGEDEEARVLLERHMAEHPDDEEARAVEIALDATTDGVARPVGALDLRCLVCGHTDHQWHEYLLNTRGLTLFGYDQLNRAADCYVCTHCRYVHWFLRHAPGAFQALHPERRKDPAAVLGDEKPGGCLVCGYDRAYERTQLVNSRMFSLLGLDFLNKGSTALVCTRCGFMHWRRPDADQRLPRETPGPPDPPLLGADLERAVSRCVCCGGMNRSGRRAVLNTRGMTQFRLDWLSRGARVSQCADCGGLSWFSGI